VRPLTETTLEEWRAVQAVNLDGVFLGTKHAVRAMRQHGEGGSIVNVSSASGLVGAPLSSAYCTSKGGVRLFTKAVALECAAEGIRVNSRSPRRRAARRSGRRPASRSKTRPRSLVPRPSAGMAEPEEVADAILYLASDASRFVTGSDS
jgi:NAD(P)-dependent dehydrogenase (short-subunit alcohol dehydrogenase family)